MQPQKAHQNIQERHTKFNTLTLYTLYTGLLISPQPDQEGNKLMFLSEWREIPLAPCLAAGWGGRELDDSSRLDVVEIARVPDMLPRLFPLWSDQVFISSPV